MNALKRARIFTAMAGASLLAFGPLANAEFGLIEGYYPDSEGYTLFAPYRGTSAYLIDRKGRLLNRWDDPDGYSAGGAMFLSKRGTLVRATLVGNSGNAGAGAGGLIREYDWYGNVIWEFVYDDVDAWQHHDIVLMPKGNVLITAFERVILDETTGSCRNEYGEINRSGSATEGVAFDHLIEVKPDYKNGGGEIVWEWHLCDHLGADDPGKWDPAWPQNFNSLDYDPHRDQILIGCNFCNELFIIDRSIDSEEAQGPAGDFLYRWGNPQNYGRGTAEDQKLAFNHTVRFITNEFGFKLGKGKKHKKSPNGNGFGNIIAYNNRHEVNGPCANGSPICSAIVEITPPYHKKSNSYEQPPAGLPYGPADFSSVVQNIVDGTGNRDFDSRFLSSGQKLYHDRVSINVGAGRPVTEFFVTDSAGDVQWHYVPPVFSFNPGRTGGGDKDPDLCMTADAAALPAGGTQWPFRAIRYAKKFKGFEHVRIKRGPLLTDVEPLPGLDYGPCPTVERKGPGLPK